MKITSLLTFILYLLLAGSWAQATDATDDQGPYEIIDNASRTILGVLHDKSIDRFERNSRILSVVDELFNYDVMAKLSMDMHWHQMTESQRTEYAALFTGRVKHMYLGTLYNFTRDDIRVGSARQIGKECVAVPSWLINNGVQTEVTYKFHRSKPDNNAWRVYDIKIEGVSLVQAYRADFSSYMGTGCATGLIKKLREYQPD